MISSFSLLRSLGTNLFVYEKIRSHSADINGIDSRSIANFERHGKLAVYVPDHSNGFSISMDGSAQYLWYSSLRLVVS
jgi:hypothetical protein